MRASDGGMIENKVIVGEVVARLRAQFFPYFLNTVILRAQFIACILKMILGKYPKHDHICF